MLTSNAVNTVFISVEDNCNASTSARGCSNTALGAKRDQIVQLFIYRRNA